MKQWWQSLNKREQNLVSIAALLVAIGLLYWGLWLPLSNANQQAQQRLLNQQQTLQWAQQQGSLLIASGGNTQVDTQVNVSQAVSSSARQQRITISRIQPQGEEVELWIESVPFNQLMAWLKMLSQHYGIIVQHVDLSEGKQQGIVGVRRLRLGKAE
ncbi:type II secretion system protein GspM [Agarivorans sp.]|uniref:type II secretion system protein GspM n=1 Tax=Agarivorans sp. TaxID=1872412 RepID=UPI003D00F757